MKFALVVASGVREGTVIPAPGPKLTVGRGEGCHLRPASPSISTRHCEFTLRDGTVYVRDLGSTNGTLVNDVPATDEVALQAGDRIKVGPLDFTLKLIDVKADAKPGGGSKSSGLIKPATKPESTAAAKPTPAAKPAARPGSVEDDAMAAMLLGMDDDEPVEVPGGSTIMEMPAVDAEAIVKATAEKKPAAADSSDAARNLLNMYTQRPRIPPSGKK